MLHRHELKVFLLSRSNPSGLPRPGPTLNIEASTLDGLLPSAKHALAKAGFANERAISFTPTGLVAYVEEPP